MKFALMLALLAGMVLMGCDAAVNPDGVTIDPKTPPMTFPTGNETAQEAPAAEAPTYRYEPRGIVGVAFGNEWDEPINEVRSMTYDRVFPETGDFQIHKRGPDHDWSMLADVGLFHRHTIRYTCVDNVDNKKRPRTRILAFTLAAAWVGHPAHKPRFNLSYTVNSDDESWCGSSEEPDLDWMKDGSKSRKPSNSEIPDSVWKQAIAVIDDWHWRVAIPR